ncbi:MAG: hypothetical protein P9L92_11895 [Candidatus Electryonea clarkiae]|nr:hypothetical protein [Candidatus Electryonea clarkiae]
MTKSSLKMRLKQLLVGCLVFVIANQIEASGIRLRGSIGLRSYGYQDVAEENHLWLFQTTRFSAYQRGGPISFHFSGGYRGDNADDFSHSGRARLLKGYLQLDDPRSKTTARLGRFFLYRGVAVGVIDGLELSRQLHPGVNLTAFAGMMGPLSRKFEISDPNQDASFGGEIRFKVPVPYTDSNNLAVSYTNQIRDEKEIRQRLGIANYSRMGSHIRWLNLVHLRLQGSPFSRFISRIRYNDQVWNTHFEYAFRSVDISDYSWFSEFGHLTSSRIRLGVNRYLLENKWGAGIEGALLLKSDFGGRLGPVIITPYGQAGYRISMGDQSSSQGPWASLRLKPHRDIELNVTGAMVNYEWDAIEIENDELVMLNAGVRYMPRAYDRVTISAEYQVYQTPQLSQDRRAMGGILWRFDTGGKR